MTRVRKGRHRWICNEIALLGWLVSSFRSPFRSSPTFSYFSLRKLCAVSNCFCKINILTYLNYLRKRSNSYRVEQISSSPTVTAELAWHHNKWSERIKSVTVSQWVIDRREEFREFPFSLYKWLTTMSEWMNVSFLDMVTSAVLNCMRRVHTETERTLMSSSSQYMELDRLHEKVHEELL